MSEHFTPVCDIHNYPTRFRVKLNTNLDSSILTDSKRYTFQLSKGLALNHLPIVGVPCGTAWLNISGIPEHNILLNLGSRNIF